MPASPVRFQHRLEYAGFRLVEAWFSAMPVETASRVMGRLWRLVAPRLSRHARALRHLEAALPQTTPQEREAIALEMWEGLGRTLGESFHLHEIVGAQRLDVVIAPDLRARLQAGKGGVLCGTHLANWEAVAGISKHLDIELAGVYQRLTNPLVDARVREIRAWIYTLGLFPKEASTARQMLKLARDGKLVAFLTDLRANNGIMVPFFGRDAPTLHFPALIARSCGAPLVAARMERLPDVHFRVTLVEIDMPRTDDREADIREATARLQKQIEDWIRERPGQWTWAHRRWG